jgi:hypothetical protein
MTILLACSPLNGNTIGTNHYGVAKATFYQLFLTAK